MRVVGVSKLAYILFSERINSIIVDYKNIKRGIYYHRIFGFDQQDVKCEVFYKYKGEVFLIRGKPDDVYIDNGYIVISELKTCNTEKLREIMGMMGFVQANIYSYLLTRGKKTATIVNSYVYNPRVDSEPRLFISTHGDDKLADWCIRRSLDLILKDAEDKDKIISYISQHIKK